MAINIFQARIEDTDDIMDFINNYWRKGHILGINKEFFLYEFQREDKLNMIIARNSQDNKILGFLGFYYFNNKDLPDMSGSIWKIHPEVKDQLLGVKIRNHLIKTINHNFFATPGPGLHMKPVYKILRMNWHRMEQYYIANKNVEKFKLAVNPIVREFEKTYSNNIKMEKVNTIEDIEDYIFDETIAPLKDKYYIKRRYFEHPIYKYDVFVVKDNSKIKNIFVGRKAHAENRKAYRLVDYIGNTELIKEITTFLYDFIHTYDIEYIDFINCGYDENVLHEAGFEKLDFDSEEIIIPNYFEPFVQKNVPVYCVADKTDKIYRQHKADGDMDRPSIA